MQRLLARRADIENLQTTLSTLIANPSAKKLDVDDIRHRLAEGLRSSKKGGDFMPNAANTTLNYSNKENSKK